MVNVAAPSLNESMKLIVGNYLNAIKPADVYFGTVESVSPLSIKIDQKHILKEQSLILSNMVKDHPVDLTVSFQTENDKFLIKDHTHPYEDTQPNGQPVTKITQTTVDLDVTHKHEIKHKIRVIQHYALTVGEKVILLRLQGGQRYLVLDRVEIPPTNGEWL